MLRPLSSLLCRGKEGLRGSEMGLPLMVSFTALFLKEHKQMGSRSNFCLENR